MGPADIKYDVTMAIKMINKMTPTFDIAELYAKVEALEEGMAFHITKEVRNGIKITSTPIYSDDQGYMAEKLAKQHADCRT